MAGINNFKSVAAAPGANVLTQADYELLTSLLANGWTSGVVASNRFNKMWRQTSVIAAMIGQYIADQGYDALDNGDTATLLANLKNALAVQIDAQSGNFTIDTGAANAYAVAVNPPITAYPDGMTLRFRAANANTGASTLNAGAGAVPLRNNIDGALVAGDIPALSLVTVTYIAALGHFVINTMVPSQNAVSGNGCVQGTFKNLVIGTFGTNATVTATVDEIALKSSANVYITRRAVSISINTAAAGKNGLSTGTLAANTWYAVFAGYDGTSDCGWIDPSATSPTPPSGVTHWARIGWIRTDGTANKYPLFMLQLGRRVQHKISASANLTALPVMSAGTVGNIATPTWVAVAVGAFVPPTAASIMVVGWFGGGTGTMMLAPNNAYGAYNSATNPPPFVLGQSGTGTPNNMCASLLLEGSNIYFANQIGSGGLSAFGWEDNL